MDYPATWQLIRDFGIRRYTRCKLCDRQNLWELEYNDGKETLKLCTNCDVEYEKHGNTGSEKVNAWLF